MASTVDGAHEILRADPVARRRALVIVVVGGTLGAVAIQWLLPWARGEIEQAVYDGTIRKSVVCRSVLAGLMFVATPVAAFGVYVFRFGRHVAREERFPPAGMKVVRDTRVLTGRAARLLGRAQAINGALLVVLPVGLFGLCAYGFLALALR